MCCSQSKNMRDEGAEIVFGELSGIAALLRAFIPCGRVALIADGEKNFSAVREIQSALKGFESFCMVVGEKESAIGLFSLPDDVRAAIAVGNGSFYAARYFCTLRGAYCIAVPDDATLSTAFESPVPLKVGGERSRYPADPPDAVYCDVQRMRGYAAAYGDLCLCALSSFDFEVHSVFAGGDLSSPYRRIFDRAIQLDYREEGAFKEELLSLSSQYRLLRQKNGRRTDTEVFCALMRDKLHCDGGAAALFSYRYLCERYRHFFKSAVPRDYFVPDYPGRIHIAAAYAGEDERALFLKNRVPTAKRTYDLAEVYRESRTVFYHKAESAAVWSERIKSILFALGVKAPQIDAVRAHEAFSVSAELSDTLSVPSLMRDFGLLTQ